MFYSDEHIHRNGCDPGWIKIIKALSWNGTIYGSIQIIFLILQHNIAQRYKILGTKFYQFLNFHNFANKLNTIIPFNGIRQDDAFKTDFIWISRLLLIIEKVYCRSKLY